MATYIQSLSLTYSIELGSVVLSDDLSVRIFLISGLLYMLPATSVCLCLKLYIILDRL